MRECMRTVGFCLLLISSLSADEPALRRSDVVFMYQAGRSVYEEYGATVLAWGGKPTPQSKADAEAAGVRFFGSVGMVTEFASYYRRFPDSYEDGLCRNVDGQPVKVPWLTDHEHDGVPFWWCCTQQPQFRQYLKERVVETVKAGADGVHIDDHLGTAGGLWLGTCLCQRCVEGFRAHLKTLPNEALRKHGIENADTYDYRDALRQWRSTSGSTPNRSVQQHPLWNEWCVYQGRAAAAFMMELRALAASTAGRPVPIGANAGLLWPRHLADYRALDLFSAETDHHAAERRFSDDPLFAYRLAEAVERPYSATASGGDWAFVKEHEVPGQVRGWIALSYAAGQCFMAPHRQWCYTPEKGTHWYSGPAEKFAPLYRFVRAHSDWFDGYTTYADVAVVMPHRSYLKDSRRWVQMGNRLAEANVSYRLLLAGDELVDHPLSAEMVQACPVLLIPERDEFLPADRELLERETAGRRVFASVSELLSDVKPAVQSTPSDVVRVLPRVGQGSAVVHLLNYAYDAARDDVQALDDVQVRLDLDALGVPKAAGCTLLAPDAPPQSLSVVDGVVSVPKLHLWALLKFAPP
ncbi:MAG: hypothetical protein FJ276_05265 [Planctomycetes bacterium]|nr:hypothetical protein [Planctomycetota bacterium]